MGGTLLNKRYIKRKGEEQDREEGEIPASDEAEPIVPRKRLKQAERPSEEAKTSHTNTRTDAKRRVSFNALAPSVVSIDGLGSEIIQRFRDSMWYTKRDYRTFWKDRIETVRVWHSLYGGIEDDEYVARMLDDSFTIRGLENYVCDPTQAAENLDPKKNRYVQAVLRSQQNGPVDAQAIHEEVKEITGASLRKAQALAILDAQAALPMFHQSIQLNTMPKFHQVPDSPQSVIDLGNTTTSSRTSKKINKKLLEHMDEGQRRKIIIEHRRNSMQLYQAEERRKSEMSKGRLSVIGGDAPQHRRQSLSGVPSATTKQRDLNEESRYGMIMRAHRDSLAMGRGLSSSVRQPTTIKQHPRPVSAAYARDSLSLGPRPSRKQSLDTTQGYSMPRHRQAQLGRAGMPSQYYFPTECRPNLSYQQQQRRDSVYGTIVTNPQSVASVQMPRASQMDPSTYTEMIGGFPGMRRDSLAGHYEHTT